MSCVARVTALMLSIISELLQAPSGNMGIDAARRTPSPSTGELGARGRVDHVKAARSLLDYRTIGRRGGCRMRAMDVMTTNVITVDPETSVQALATLLSERGISAIPIADRDGRLVGIVTEGDLLHRAETGTERRTERRRRRWLDAFATDQEAARDYIKSHGRTVREIMTREVISVSDTTDLADI